MRFFVARDRRDYIHIYDMLDMCECSDCNSAVDVAITTVVTGDCAAI